MMNSQRNSNNGHQRETTISHEWNADDDLSDPDDLDNESVLCDDESAIYMKEVPACCQASCLDTAITIICFLLLTVTVICYFVILVQKVGVENQTEIPHEDGVKFPGFPYGQDSFPIPWNDTIKVPNENLYDFYLHCRSTPENSGAFKMGCQQIDSHLILKECTRENARSEQDDGSSGTN